MYMFSFPIIIPVKSFELTLNSNSLDLYRRKSGGGGAGLQYSCNRYVLKHNIADDIVPCTLNSFLLYRHTSVGKKQVHSTAVVQQG